MRTLILLFSIGCSLSILSSCGEHFFYEKTNVIPDEEWTYSYLPSFAIDIQDTLARYDLYLSVQHSSEFPYQNMYILFHTETPKGKKQSDQVPIDLAHKTGAWYGDCDIDWCTVNISLQQDIQFTMQGTYVFRLEQYLREDTLAGIKSIGLKLRKNEVEQ